MAKATETILILALVWGLPVYFIDRRARRNHKPTNTQILIAFLMLFYYLIVPVFIALKLAGFDVHWPARQRWVDEARYRRHLEQQDDHDWWQERQEERDREEEARRNQELDELQARREEEDEDRRRAEQEALDNAYWAEQEEQEQRRQQN